MGENLGDILQGIGNVGQAVAALVAIVGIPFIALQVRLQARNSRLDVLRAVEDQWQNRSQRAQEVLKDAYSQDSGPQGPDARIEQFITEHMTSHGLKVATTYATLDRTVPYISLTLCPTLRNLMPSQNSDGGPRGEKRYKDVLMARCRYIFPLLDKLDELDAEEPEKKDFVAAVASASACVDALNGIAEPLESRIADPVDFMRRRHLAVLREVHAVEPLILWRTAHDQNGRWGMRVLALGEAARQFHWRSKLHYRREVGLAMIQKGSLAIDSNYGCVLSGSKRRRLREVLSIYFKRRNRAVTAPFHDRNKLKQEKLIGRARTALLRSDDAN